MNSRLPLVATSNDRPIRRRKWRPTDGIDPELERFPFLLDAIATETSKSYRRLPFKTQVYGPSRGVHIRTRASHTSDLREAAAKAAVLLRLNEHLAEAIARLHDIGHTPFGHEGERVLSRILSEKTGREIVVEHSIISCALAQRIEAKGQGLNLDFRTLHGAAYHSLSSPVPSITPEAELIRILDKVAYLSGDINDTIRAHEQGICELDHLLVEDMRWRARFIGSNQHTFMERCVGALVEESLVRGYVSFEESETAQLVRSFRSFMYENVYNRIDWSEERRWLEQIYQFFSDFGPLEGADPALMLACLTDEEARMIGRQLDEELRPSHTEYMKLGVRELVKTSRKVGLIDLTEPDLDWH